MLLFDLRFFRLSKASLFVCLALLSDLAIASAQSARHKPLPKEQLEKYDQPPAYIWRIGVSAGMVSQHGPFTSYQVNVDSIGRNITGDAANEPSICVDPTNANKLAIGWRQFNSVASNFRQAGWGYTNNGGTSWTFPGILENNVFRSDPVLNSDTTGRFLYFSLLQTFFVDIWRSLNGGMSWMRLAAAMGGDKQWFTIDNTNSTGHGFQYQWWSTAGNNFQGRQFSRSIDGGATWLDPVFIPNTPVWGTLDVDATGNLFLGGVNPDTNQFWCIRSTNAKNPAAIPSFDRSTAVGMGGDVGINNLINPEGLLGQAFLAVDRSGTSTNNNIYMVASVVPAEFTSGSDVMFVRSTNGGQTFSAPRRINTDPVNHNKWHWFGTLAVAPNGRIDVIWLDTRAAANNTDSQLFYSYSADGGISWSPNVAVSNSFSPFQGYPQQNKMGDYMTIVSDNTGANVAYCATFNGEQDIYYVRLSPVVPLLAGDFNRDSFTDYLLFNPSTRRTAIWDLRGNVFLNGIYGPNVPAGYRVAYLADVNLDGKLDFVLSNSATLKTAIWFLDNATFLSGIYGPNLPPDWTLIAAVDINHDGHPDYVLFNPSTRRTAVWFLNGAAVVTSSTFGPTLPIGWTLVDAEDFNHDSKPDFLLVNDATRQTAIWYLNGVAFTTGASGPPLPVGWTLQRAADFNSDGKPDYLLLNPSTRRTALWYLNGVTLTGSAYGPTLPPGY